MQTPWGDISVADAHVHFFSPAFFQSLAQQKTAGDIAARLAWDLPNSSESLADRWVAEMDRAGIAQALLIGSTPGDVESVGAAVTAHRDRFRSVVMVNPLLPGADARIVAALDEELISGIFLFPAMHRFSMHDTHVHSLLALVSGYPGTAVYVHCGMLSLAFRAKLGLPSPFDIRFSNPIDIHGPALAFPNLPFVIPHFGAGYFREALMLAGMCPNIYFDTSSSNRWMRCEPWPIDLPHVFRKSLEILGPKRILFGSDSSWFPRGFVRDVFDAQVQALSGLKIDEESARAIFGGNLRGLFKGPGFGE